MMVKTKRFKLMVEWLISLFFVMLLILTFVVIMCIIVENVYPCECPCGAVDGCCPCPNQDTLKYFETNCKQYFKPSSAGSMDQLTNICNKELNASLKPFE